LVQAAIPARRAQNMAGVTQRFQEIRMSGFFDIVERIYRTGVTAR
jgi:hypothetical protein